MTEAYDFDTAVDRRGTGSLKWDVAENELPMWVADMDFQTAPAVREALERRVRHGVFGYAIVPDAWYEAYNGLVEGPARPEAGKGLAIFCTGVVPAISSMVRKLTTPAEKVLIQTPVYNIFFNSILNNGRQVLESPLVYENGALPDRLRGSGTEAVRPSDHPDDPLQSPQSGGEDLGQGYAGADRRALLPASCARHFPMRSTVTSPRRAAPTCPLLRFRNTAGRSASPASPPRSL